MLIQCVESVPSKKSTYLRSYQVEVGRTLGLRDSTGVAVVEFVVSFLGLVTK